MASSPLVQNRACRKCGIEKPLSDFPLEKRWPTHKCRACSKADRRAKYQAREGQYALIDSPEAKAKRSAEYRSRVENAKPVDLSAYAICRSCGKERVLADFVKKTDGRASDCKDCRAAKRRVAYSKRSGEYLDWDTDGAKKKRRAYAKTRRGLYLWDESWINQRPTKDCGRCKIELPANPAWFTKCSANKTGLASWCHSCCGRDYYEHRNKRLIGQRRYWRKIWKRDPTKLLEERAARRNRNPERTRSVNRSWYADNIDRERKRSVAKENTRRARKQNATGTFTAADVEAMLSAQKGTCWYCSVKFKKYHVDHRIPLARGGTNDPSNLVLACPPCNFSKGAKMPWQLKNPRLL